MKKNNIRIITAAAGILLLTACSNDGGIGRDADAGSITIDATIGHMTKVMYDADATSFTSGDAILLYGWTGSGTEVPQKRVVDSVTCSFDGTKWTPAKQMLWKNTADAHYFLGIYPVPDSVTSFTAAAYRLNPTDYTASDLLIATTPNGVKATGAPVNLTFEHAMAKLIVNLRFNSEWDTAPTVTGVTVTAKDCAKVNYLTKEVSAQGGVLEVLIPVASIAASGYDKSYSGIQIPQTGVKCITISTDSREFIYEADQDIPLNQGSYTTINLKLGREKVELDKMSVSDWSSGSDLGCKDALYDPYNGHEYVDMGNGLKWATCNVGAENPWDYGDYFAWGETNTKEKYDWASYKWMEAGQSDWKRITKYTFANSAEYVTWWYDGETFKGDNGDGVEHKDLASYDYVDDAARANWGGTWRTPTDSELTWLRENCTWVWQIDYNSTGVNGMLVTSNVNGNSIFLPAAGSHDENEPDVGYDGCYWSSSLFDSPFYHGHAIVLNFKLWYDVEYVDLYDEIRFFGNSVRPVTN